MRPALDHPLLLALAMLLPIAVIILFSFNNPSGRRNFVWTEFSLDAWLNPFGIPGLASAVTLSLIRNTATIRSMRIAHN